MPILEAGWELDRAVAKAIGYRRHIAVGRTVSSVSMPCSFLDDSEAIIEEIGADDPRMPAKAIPKYSTDLNAAFAAAEKVGLFGEWHLSQYSDGWTLDDRGSQPAEWSGVTAATPALAICAAILNFEQRAGRLERT